MPRAKKKPDEGHGDGQGQTGDGIADLQNSLDALDPELKGELEPAEDLGEVVTEEESQALMEGISAVMANLSDSDMDSSSPQLMPEPSDGNRPADAPLTDDEIAALISQAVDSPRALEPADEPEMVEEPEPEEEEELLSEDELADLVRNMIAEQGVALDEAAEAVEPEVAASAEPAQEVAEPAEEIFEAAPDQPLNDDEIATLLAQAANLPAAAPVAEVEPVAVEPEPEPVAAGGVLSASQLAALLNAPDPDGELVPEESAAMDPDELAQLVAEASDLQADPAFEEATAPAAATVSPEPSQPAPSAWTSACDIGAVKAVPSHLAIRALALPVIFHEGKLLCRVATPVDQVSLDKLSKATGFGIVVEPAPILEIVSGLKEVYSEVQESHARTAVLDGAKPNGGALATILGMFKRSA